jgi:hypothetical protein
MTDYPKTLALRTVGEWALHSASTYANPFADVVVDATFVSPTGRALTVPGFYDGAQTWRVRFCPGEAGRWGYRVSSRPHDAELCAEGSFEVSGGTGRGYLQATPGQAWGFQYESGEPAFLFGDTVYNLFGVAHCGIDVQPFLARRARQGFNLLRMRLPVSPFHPPEGYSLWQTRRTWPWGGSEQAPRFDQFNLDYFRTVDQVVHQAEALSLGIEMIMEAWGFEFPFNSRQIFVPEWEELWLRYLIARYDAYNCVYFWTLMNEYEYYPNGDWHYKPVADRWAMRLGRWVKGLAQHGHIVSVHNGPREPAFGRRFAADPQAVDAVMFQDWGTRDEQQGWLAAGIEDAIARGLKGWTGSAVLAEWGYERNSEFPLLLPSHLYCDDEHTRRGGWRGAFCGLGIIHGFENSWGPYLKLEEDQPGMAFLLILRRFFTEVLPFARLQPAPEIVAPATWQAGHQPLVLASAERDVVAIYLPVGGGVALNLPTALVGYRAQWFDPCTGQLSPTAPADERFCAPTTVRKGHPQDWVLVLRRT